MLFSWPKETEFVMTSLFPSLLSHSITQLSMRDRFVCWPEMKLTNPLSDSWGGEGAGFRNANVESHLVRNSLQFNTRQMVLPTTQQIIFCVFA